MDKLVDLAKQDLSLFEKCKEYIDGLLESLRKSYAGLTPDSREANEVLKMTDAIEELHRLWEEAALSARENYLSGGKQKNTTIDGDVKLSERSVRSEYNKPITLDDINALRSIGRKSINNFTAEDIEKAQKWAYKFFQQLGVKSPFFRAWFGDWRAYDINEVKFKTNTQLLSINNPEKAKEYFLKGIRDKTLFRGDIENLDTGFIINVGTQIYNDTLTYANREFSRYKNVKDYQVRLSVLSNIETIVKHSVLLDTEVAYKDRKKSSNMYQSFFHKLYTLIEIEGEQYLVKLTVDELNSDNTIRRAYNVNDIKISPVAVSQVYRPADTTDDNGDLFSDISISKLHTIVKQYDKSFSPKTVDKRLLNEDGTPKKFYHGTSEKFTEFNPDEFAPREGSFFFAENKEDAWAYGNNVLEVYLTGDKFADYDNQPSEFYQLKDKRKQVEYLKERGYDGWFADMDSEGWGEVSVFSNTQIKSATDNIGTFDKTNPDIRYSDRDYSYDELISKPDMKITMVNDKVVYKPSSTIRKNIVNQAIKNATSIGKTNENGNVVIRVDDIETDVIVSKSSLTHGLDRRLQVSAPVILNIGSVLKNSVRINELTPKTQSAKESYVLIGYAESADNAYIVRMVVNNYTNEMDSVDVLYAVNTKKETVGIKPGSHGKTTLPTVSTISISNLLEYVNRFFPDVFPEDVLKHYGHQSRPQGDLGGSALFQDRVSIDMSTRGLLAGALESSIDAKTPSGQIQLKKLREYKEHIESLNELSKTLSEQRKEIHSILSVKGGRTAETQKRLVYLQGEVVKNNNRVNTLDKKLLNLEVTAPLKAVLETEKKEAAKRQKAKNNPTSLWEVGLFLSSKYVISFGINSNENGKIF